MDTKLAALKDLHELKTSGAVDQGEYDRLKAEILQRRTEGGKGVLHWLSGAKTLAWPVIALLVLWLFYGPIKEKIVASNELALGSFSVKVEEVGARSGNPQLLATVKRLSPEAIKTMLSLNEATDYMLLSELKDSVHGGTISYGISRDLKALMDLQQGGLLSCQGMGKNFDLEAFYKSLLERGQLHHRISYHDPLNPNSYSDNISTHSPDTQVDAYLLASEMDPQYPKLRESLSVQLTPDGRLAAKTIVNAAAEIISTRAEKPAAEKDKEKKKEKEKEKEKEAE